MDFLYKIEEDWLKMKGKIDFNEIMFFFCFLLEIYSIKNLLRSRLLLLISQQLL